MKSPTERLLAAFARSWAFLLDLRLVLRPCRFSAFVVVVGGALLLAVPQGRELTVRLADEGMSKNVWFCLAVVAWSFQSWYWARLLLDATFGPAPDPKATRDARAERIAGLVRQLPRVISFVSYAVAIIACLMTWTTHNMVVGGVLLALGVANYVLFVKRQSIVLRIVERFHSHGRSILEPGTGRGFGALSTLSKWVFWASFGTSAVFLGWALIGPVGMGWTLGASAVPFIGFASMVPVGSLAVFLARHGGSERSGGEAARYGEPPVGYPVVTIFIALAVLFSLWVDNHGVRSLGAAASPARQPVALTKAVDDWYARTAQPAGDKPVKLVVVATAGGGIRAAYWTATVLGALQDRAPTFGQQVLGISGVSGGSLGATTFATLISLDRQHKLPAAAADCSGGTAPRGRYECLGQQILSRDFLSPTVSALLFTDLMQQFIPFAVLPDRAAALEKGWEQAWRGVGVEPAIWSENDFGSLWRVDGYVPALLLNGTSVETGKRIITSNLRIERDPFRDSFDFFDMFDREGRHRAIRPSTAAHNSARFTYVSPAGRINRESRIVDGGYYENFGAKTAGELLRAAVRQLGPKVQPIVVLISNDTKIDPAEMPATGVTAAPSAPLREPRGVNFASEGVSPLLALLATRDAHGVSASHELRDAAGREGRIFHFRLCDDPEREAAVLGWALSKGAEALIRSQLRACGNGEQFDSLVRALAD